jgi:F-type H+-transporting ATPase subunit gamma
MSQTLEALHQKIKSGQDLGSIVKTMKSLAATSVLQYEQAVISLKSYTHTVEMGLSIVLKDIEQVQPLKQEDTRRTLIIVFGSDHSLVGRFNEQIVHFALSDYWKQINRLYQEDTLIFSIGDQVVQRLLGENVKISEHFELPTSVLSITETVMMMLNSIEAYQRSHRISEVLLMFNKPTQKASYHPTTKMLLPVDLYALSKQGKKWDSNSLPTYRVDSKVLLSALLHQYFFIVLYQSFAWSLAAENAARLIAMQAAEKNIEELLNELKIQYQQARQAEITEELMDIIAGFKALKAKKKPAIYR